METTDREVMARVARRDETAFSILVERYGGRLLAVARRLLGSRADAEDAVQRALLQCYTAASSYGRSGPCRRGSIASSPTCAWTSCGGGRPGPPTTAPRAPCSTRRVPASLGGTWICIARSRACRGRRAFSSRSATRRGSPTASSPQIRGISVNTVKSQLARGKAVLREELGKRGILHD